VHRNQALGVIGVTLVLVLVSVPFLEADPAGLVAGSGVDPGQVRVAAAAAAVLIAFAGVFVAATATLRTAVTITSVTAACLVLVCAPTIQAVRYRAAHQPWVYVNDSAYQVEVSGDLLRHATNPYGHDYHGSGLERLYAASPETATRSPAALTHFAYFPLLGVIAAGWRLAPKPVNDIRVFVMLATVALLAAALWFPAPLTTRLVAGLLLAANPLMVRGAWFGTLDAVAILPLVVSFAALARRRYTIAGITLALAVLTKQFVVVAGVFLLVETLRSGGLAAVRRAGGAFAATLVVVVAPFVAWNATAFWRDTITYGADTYRIVGYGLSNLLVHAGIVNRYGSYPFVWIALVTWVPVTVVSVIVQRRVATGWAAPSAFAVSMLVLVYVARVFQTSYLAYPAAGVIIAGLLASAGRDPLPPTPDADTAS
jgi:hypothetical protein